MNIKNYYQKPMGLFCLVLFTACVDSDYDLSDIDTTARFATKNLVVPINIESVTLDQVLDLNDTSIIVSTYDENGNPIYAMEKTGSFNSKEVVVNPFRIPIPEMKPTKTTLNLEDLRKAKGFVKTDGTVMAYYEIKEGSCPEVSFESSNVNFNKSIKKMEHIGVSTKYINKIKVDGLSPKALQNTKLTDLQIQYPKGMVVKPGKGVYDSKTGILDLTGETLQLDSNGELSIQMEVESIEYDGNNMKVDYDKHHIRYMGAIRILRGKVSVYIDTNLKNTITLNSEYYLETIDVKNFTGNLEYEIEDFNIDPVHINDLPDILSQTGTELNIENPQIFISLTNPLHAFDIKFRTDIEITAQRDGKSKTYKPDDGAFETKSAKPDHNNFVLSPTVPPFYYKGYNDVQHVAFSGLKKILTDVDGVPSIIEMKAIDPLMPEQHVVDFTLGKHYGQVLGTYAFFAPLQFSDKSQVVYTDTIDGWNDDDLDAVTIEKLTVNFDATTEVPFVIELTVIPIDLTGKPIAGVKSSTAKIPAWAKNEPVEVSVEGEIVHLDGILLEARIVNQGSTTTLAPTMELFMNNCKATVTGAYEKEL